MDETLYQIKVVESSTHDTFGREMAEAMRLPFDQGWEAWGIFRDDTCLIDFDNYEDAVETLNLLNSIIGKGSELSGPFSLGNTHEISLR